MFDYLFTRKSAIESAFGAALNWRRMDDKKASIIEFAETFDGYDKANWPSMTKWLITHMERLERAFQPEIGNLRQARNKAD